MGWYECTNNVKIYSGERTVGEITDVDALRNKYQHQVFESSPSYLLKGEEWKNVDSLYDTDGITIRITYNNAESTGDADGWQDKQRKEVPLCRMMTELQTRTNSVHTSRGGMNIIMR